MNEQLVTTDRMDGRTTEAPDPWECALGFMDAQILFAADELGVFDCLAGGAASLDEVAEAAGLPVDAAERLLTALCALRLVEKTPEQRFVNSAEADEKLVRNRPGYIGSMFHHLRAVLYPAWGSFTEILRAGGVRDRSASAPSEGVYADPEGLREFMDGMHAIAYPAAVEFAERAPEFDAVEHVVDVGGASGAFLIALAEAFPTLRGTVIDLPPVAPIAAHYFRRHGVEDRLDFTGGDFFDVPFPEDADAYALGFILHDWNEEDGSHLLEKIARSIRPGGLLVVGEYLLDEDRTGPLHVARSDLNMMVAARGRERTAAEYRNWIAAFGFAVERIIPTSEGKHFLMARRRGLDGSTRGAGVP